MFLRVFYFYFSEPKEVESRQRLGFGVLTKFYFYFSDPKKVENRKRLGFGVFCEILFLFFRPEKEIENRKHSSDTAVKGGTVPLTIK